MPRSSGLTRRGVGRDHGGVKKIPDWLVSIALLSGLCGISSAGDWPTYMHDNSRVGCTPDPLPAPLEQGWVFESPVEPQRAFSGPDGKMYEGKELRSRIRFDDVFHVAMAGGRVFFGSSVDGRVHCIDAATGREVWSFFTDGPVRLAPTVVDGRVFVGSDDGCAYCLDAGSGEVIWKLRAGPRDERLLARGRMTSRWPVRTSLMVDDGIVYFGAGVFPAETVLSVCGGGGDREGDLEERLDQPAGCRP